MLVRMNTDTPSQALPAAPSRLPPRGMRPHVGIFGRRNAGKSSLFNCLLRQDASIVSPVAGTTADPVERIVELHGLGAVQLIDTAGLDDDAGALGAARGARSRRTLDRVDAALLACDAWGGFERDLLRRLRHGRVPVIVVCTKADLRADRSLEEGVERELGEPPVRFGAIDGEGLDPLLERLSSLLARARAEEAGPPIAGDLAAPGAAVLLVAPIDKEAPAGRLILPQVQTLRDLLDHGCVPVMARDTELPAAFAHLKAPPAIVITDSQAFRRVSAIVPDTVPLTSFSILFARYKGDLDMLARGAARIETLREGDRVLVAEACTHHPVEDDIATVKIPRLLEKKAGVPLRFEHASGRDFPGNLKEFALIVHCGSCMLNRRETLSRLAAGEASGVPVTNYGMAIAACLGILGRALRPFPSALEAWREACGAS